MIEIFFSAAGQLSGRLHFFEDQKPILWDSSTCYHCNFGKFVGQFSERIKYFVRQNEILLVLTNRPSLFAKTEIPSFAIGFWK